MRNIQTMSQVKITIISLFCYVRFMSEIGVEQYLKFSTWY